MFLTEVLKSIAKIKKGTFVRVVYTSELPLTALGRKTGVIITKKTEKVVRLGVAYNNIAEVIKQEEARTEPKREVTSWSHWVIKDIIAKHNTKDDYYLSFATVKNGAHTQTEYYIDGRLATYEQVAQSPFVLPSYFKSSGDAPVVQKVKLENVVAIGGHR